MSHFGSALSRCGRLCIVFFYYCLLPGLNCLNYSQRDDPHYGFGIKATKIPSHRSLTLTSTSHSTILPTSSPEPEEIEPEEFYNQSRMTIIILSSSFLAFIILLTTIVGTIWILRILQKQRKDKLASAVEIDDQHQGEQSRVNYNNLIHSSHSIELEPEVDYLYENALTEPSAPNMETIISPVYATVEFLPRCSVVEDYVHANTLRPEEFLNYDLPIIYDDFAGE